MEGLIIGSELSLNCRVIMAGCLIVSIFSPAAQGESWLIYGYTDESVNKSYAMNSTIVRQSLLHTQNGTKHSSTLTVGFFPTSMDYDFQESKVYFSGSNSSTFMMGFDGSVIQVASRESGILAMDWITKNIYYADEGDGSMRVCNFVHKRCANVIKEPGYRVNDIALAPEAGVMYWTDWGNATGVYKASMDGSGVVRLNSHTLKLPRSIIVDRENKRLYWADYHGIWTSNLNGDDEYLLRANRNGIKKCAVGLGQLYCTDGTVIMSCSIRDNCTHRGVVRLAPRRGYAVTSLVIAHSGGQPTGRRNNCATTNNCSHICVLAGQGHKCLCPTEVQVSEDDCKGPGPFPSIMSQPERSSSTDHGKIAVAAAIPTLVALLLIAIAVAACRKYLHARVCPDVPRNWNLSRCHPTEPIRPPKKIPQRLASRLTQEDTKEFLEGNECADAAELESGAERAMRLPFQMALSPDEISVELDSKLGSGNFGIVYRGTYKLEVVAIKTFEKTLNIDELKAVLAETKIMAYIGTHEHIVKFIGADVSQISERKLSLVTEMSPYGDLECYLRKLTPSCLDGRSSNPDGVSPITLLSWCSQIASAMEHLEAKKVVHGDLAARNVLLFKENVLKITDFGLSKQLYTNPEYISSSSKRIPWRWCAMELLTQREFSTDSDIWAFGVTAWEILSLGWLPYGDFEWSTEFLQYLGEGNRLDKPPYANDESYRILLECWSLDRSSRPRFSTLREFFHEQSKNFISEKAEVPVPMPPQGYVSM